jgi:hypothetical protein
MRDIHSDSRQNLYQSQWWTRLAAFTERPERKMMSDTLQFVVIVREKSLTGDQRQRNKLFRTFNQICKEGATSVIQALAFLFRRFTPIKRENLINSSRRNVRHTLVCRDRAGEIPQGRSAMVLDNRSFRGGHRPPVRVGLDP